MGFNLVGHMVGKIWTLSSKTVSVILEFEPQKGVCIRQNINEGKRYLAILELSAVKALRIYSS